MYRILFALTFTLIALFTALAQQTTPPASSVADPKARAQEVLKQARTVIWDETKSKPLQSLTINATSRSGQTNEITLDVLLPDKFLQTNVRFLGAAEFITLLAANGTQTWSDFKQPDMGALADAKRAMGGGGDGSKGGDGKKDSMGGGMSGSGVMPQVNPSDLGRMLLAWLLITPGTLPVEFTYAGEAKADGKTADVLDAKGPNDFAARLFIAQQTHQILMLTYKTPMPDTADKLEVRWVVSDYRNVNGLTLPHHLTKSAGGVMTGEIEINKVKINPSLKPDKFEKRGK